MMKSLYLLTVMVSLTSAVIMPNLGVKSNANDLQRRWRGNKPGDRGYVPEDDSQHISRGGTRSRSSLMRDDRRIFKEKSAAQGRRSRPDRPPPSNDKYGWKQENDVRGLKTSYDLEGDDIDTHFTATIAPSNLKFGIKPIYEGPLSLQELRHSYGPSSSASTRKAIKGGFEVAAGPYQFTIAQSYNPKPPLVRERHPVGNTWYRSAEKEAVFVDDKMHIRSEHGNQILPGLRKVYRYQRRSDVSNDVLFGGDNTESIDIDSNPNALTQSQWQVYYEQYLSLQAIASKLLAPVLEDVTTVSDCIATYEMAWSIETQLLGYPTTIDGPYWHGLTNFLAWENTWLLEAGFILDMNNKIYLPYNRTLSNSTLRDADIMFLNTAILRKTYYETWNAAVKAVNVTAPGNNFTVLNNLVYVAGMITSTNDTKIVPQYFFALNGTASKEHSAKWYNLIRKHEAYNK